MASREDVGRVLAYLSALYPRFELPVASIAAYFDILCDLDAGLLMLAAKKVAAESVFFPAAAEIRAAAFRLEEFANRRPDAGQAWTEVLDQVQKIGSWGTPEFSDPLIERTVAAIGWKAICESEMPGVERAHFLKVYGQLQMREREYRKMLPQVQEAIAELADDMRPLLAAPKKEKRDG